MRRFFFLLLMLPCTALHAETLLTSIKPLQLIAAAIQEGVGEPGVLLPSGASPHHFALRPSDIRRLREAELFYWIGPDLEAFLGKPLQERTGPSIAAQALEGISLRHFGENQQRHEHDHAHRAGRLDVHLWLLPQNAVLIARRMAEDLQRIDPPNSERYRRNLVLFEEHLGAVDRGLRERLGGIAGKPFFVFHETYDYFEQAYGLRHAGVFSMGSEVQPGARQVAAMRRQLEAAGASCVFSEPPMPPRLAQTLSQGLPVRLAELDALGVKVEPAAQGYAQLLENLGNDLIDCLSAH